MWFFKLMAACALVGLCTLAVVTPKVKNGSRGVVLAAAMMQLQAIAQPAVRDQIVQTTDDSEEDAANGEPEELLTQAQQIRRQTLPVRCGEQVERLRVRI